MIKIPTVLILGAGASIPYNFPSGLQLVESILSFVNPRNSYLPEQAKLKQIGNFTDKDLEEFYSALLHSGCTSIDLFLVCRPKFMKIGKIAIALSLIPFENEDNLFYFPFDPTKRPWYVKVLDKIRESPNVFHKNQLSIVTFNYDRSIDHYLFRSIQNTFDLKDDDCAKLMEAIPIVHVHGKLGKLPWEGTPYRPYSTLSNSEPDINAAIEQIKIITESEENSEEFKKARLILWPAQRIFLLGFGYNDLNLKRLQFQLIPRGRAFGTTKGIEIKDIEDIKDKWPNIEFAPNQYDIIDFFGKFINLK